MREMLVATQTRLKVIIIESVDRICAVATGVPKKPYNCVVMIDKNCFFVNLKEIKKYHNYVLSHKTTNN